MATADKEARLDALEVEQASMLKAPPKGTIRKFCRGWEPNVVLASLIVLTLVLVVGNLCTSLVAETVMRKLDEKDGILVDSKQGNPVSTTIALYDYDLDTLHSHPEAPKVLSGISKVQIPTKGGGVLGFDVEGFYWHNTSTYQLRLAGDYVLVMTNGELDLYDTREDRTDTASGRRRLCALNPFSRNVCGRNVTPPEVQASNSAARGQSSWGSPSSSIAGRLAGRLFG
jgi:hypothetical protein